MRKTLLILCATVCAASACRAQQGSARKYPGTYRLVGYAEPGTHEAAAAPREMQDMTLTIRADGSVTMHVATGKEDEEAEFVINAADSSAIITDGRDIMRVRFSHDTLVTRVPGGGPAFYWKRS